MRHWKAAPGKRASLVGDSELVLAAIRSVLRRRLGIEVVGLEECREQESAYGRARGCDLIIVAVTSHTAEPIAKLAEASLIHHIGRVPLLVVSDRPFEEFSDCRISHLRFPFDPDRLCSRVQALLEAGVPAIGAEVLV